MFHRVMCRLEKGQPSGQLRWAKVSKQTAPSLHCYHDCRGSVQIVPFFLSTTYSKIPTIKHSPAAPIHAPASHERGEELPDCFPKRLHFAFPPAVCEDSSLSTCSLTLAIVCLFDSRHPCGCEVVSHFRLAFPS